MREEGVNGEGIGGRRGGWRERGKIVIVFYNSNTIAYHTIQDKISEKQGGGIGVVGGANFAL